MARQAISGIFPGGPSLPGTPSQASSIESLQDTPVLSPGPAWSGGATAVAQPQFGSAGLVQHWTLMSIAVTGYLGLINNNPSGNTPLSLYGKFGKMLMGLSLNSYLPSGGFVFGSSQQPWSVDMLALPSDASLLTTLWDPATDPLPPYTPQYFGAAGYPAAPAENELLPVTASLLPPVPLPLDPGMPPAIGIWMLPSLLGFEGGSGYAGLSLFYASYTLNYDDGRP